MIKIVVIGMHRSGHNAISKWLLRQSSLGSKPLNRLFEDWVEEACNGSIYTFISQINHPKHNQWWNFKRDNYVLTIERDGLDASMNFIENNSIKTYQKVLVIRDFRNWLASAFKMNGMQQVKDTDVQKYESHLKEYASPKQKYPSLFIINYNMWFTNKLYREMICGPDQLNLQFTDCGVLDVPKNGRGSSFDKMKFDGKADQMKVLERYKEFEDNEKFNNMLNRYKNITELSDKVIGI